MKLVPLSERMDLIPFLASLHRKQWGGSNPVWSLADWEAEFASHAAGDFPYTVLALNDAGYYLGSASLVADDMRGAVPHTPWLANVLVMPEARSQGIAGRLIQAIESHAMLCGYGEMFLFTEDQQELYGRRGWQPFESRKHEGKLVVLMRKALHPEA